MGIGHCHFNLCCKNRPAHQDPDSDSENAHHFLGQLKLVFFMHTHTHTRKACGRSASCDCELDQSSRGSTGRSKFDYQNIPRGSKSPILKDSGSQKPYPECCLGPEFLNIGYLDPPGYC